MLSNNKLKYLRSLHQRKYRQKYHNFIAEGEKIAAEVLRFKPGAVECVCATPEWLEENGGIVKKTEAEIVPASPIELKKISTLKTPNKVLLVVQQPEPPFELEAVKKDLSLYLDDIRDPGNMGTILRVADWFGIRHVFCSKNCVEAFNPKVVQASMGAFLRVGIFEKDFLGLQSSLGDFPIFGAALGGHSIFEMEKTTACLLVIGNESRGISPEIKKGLTEAIAIPGDEKGGAESLNAAVATGILCAFFRNG